MATIPLTKNVLKSNKIAILIMETALSDNSLVYDVEIHIPSNPPVVLVNFDCCSIREAKVAAENLAIALEPLLIQ